MKPKRRRKRRNPIGNTLKNVTAKDFLERLQPGLIISQPITEFMTNTPGNTTSPKVINSARVAQLILTLPVKALNP